MIIIVDKKNCYIDESFGTLSDRRFYDAPLLFLSLEMSNFVHIKQAERLHAAMSHSRGPDRFSAPKHGNMQSDITHRPIVCQSGWI